MINRRRFLHHLGAALAVGALNRPLGRFFLQPQSAAADLQPNRHLALLADAHVSRSPRGLAAAANLRTAVAAINSHRPPIDLVCFLGDLADTPYPADLQLGWEILSTLKPPVWFLRGEQEPAGTALPPSASIAGGPWSRPFAGTHLIAFDLPSSPEATGAPPFCFTPRLLDWLLTQLAHLPPTCPLLILSHAPLYPLFPPWDWYTAGAEPLLEALRPRPQVLLLHGHVHQHLHTRVENLIFQGVRATSWPLPDVRMGTTPTCPTPAALPSPLGCGWLLLTISSTGTVTMTDQPLTT